MRLNELRGNFTMFFASCSGTLFALSSSQILIAQSTRVTRILLELDYTTHANLQPTSPLRKIKIECSSHNIVYRRSAGAHIIRAKISSSDLSYEDRGLHFVAVHLGTVGPQMVRLLALLQSSLRQVYFRRY